MAKKEVVRTQDSERILRVDMTPKEIDEAANGMSSGFEQLNTIKRALKQFKAQNKSEMETCVAVMENCARLHRDGYDMRSVPVLKELNYTKGTVKVTRKDTGEVVEKRKMTGKELQQNIDFDGVDDHADD